MKGEVVHAIPAYVPTPRGRQVSHYVLFDYPPETSCAPKTECVPCYGESEAALVRRTNERIKMLNVRVLTKEEYQAREAAQKGGAA